MLYQHSLLLQAHVYQIYHEYNMLLKESLKDKKIVFMLDEIDRLDSKDDILNIFKVIRYLASFDKVFTITAIDIEKVGEKVGLDYTHKIFNSKYTIPITTKSEIIPPKRCAI